MTGFSFLEQLIYQGFMTMVGDPLFLGFLVLGFFGTFVMLQGTRIDHKLAILVPAFILAMAVGLSSPNFVVLVILMLSGILAAAILKFTGRL